MPQPCPHPATLFADLEHDPDAVSSVKVPATLTMHKLAPSILNLILALEWRMQDQQTGSSTPVRLADNAPCVPYVLQNKIPQPLNEDGTLHLLRVVSAAQLARQTALIAYGCQRREQGGSMTGSASDVLRPMGAWWGGSTPETGVSAVMQRTLRSTQAPLRPATACPQSSSSTW